MSIQVSGTTVIGDDRKLQNYRLNSIVQSTNTTAVAGNYYIVTASITLTLPASPTIGDVVGFANQSGTTTCVIAPNGTPASQTINGVTGNMTVDINYASFILQYSGSVTKGWVFV